MFTRKPRDVYNTLRNFTTRFRALPPDFHRKNVVLCRKKVVLHSLSVNDAPQNAWASCELSRSYCWLKDYLI